MPNQPRKPRKSQLSKKLQAQASAKKSAQSKSNPKISPMSAKDQEALLNQLSDEELEKVMRPVMGTPKSAPVQPRPVEQPQDAPPHQPMKMEIGGDLIGDAQEASEVGVGDVEQSQSVFSPSLDAGQPQNAASAAQPDIDSAQTPQVPPVELFSSQRQPQQNQQQQFPALPQVEFQSGGVSDPENVGQSILEILEDMRNYMRNEMVDEIVTKLTESG